LDLRLTTGIEQVITKVNLISPNSIYLELTKESIMVPKIHTVDETVFDSITDQSAYWAGFLMTAGKIYNNKTGNPQISLTLANSERGRERLVKLRKFLKCSNQILLTHTKANGKVRNHYTLRFSSKRIAEKLIEISERFTAK
jgi:DNA-binding transcriptional regulator WhiA